MAGDNDDEDGNGVMGDDDDDGDGNVVMGDYVDDDDDVVKDDNDNIDANGVRW